MKTTGHKKCHVMVEMAPKCGRTKLKSFIVLKGGNCGVEKLNKEYGNKCIIASSTSRSNTHLYKYCPWAIFIWTSMVSLGYTWVSFNASC